MKIKKNLVAKKKYVEPMCKGWSGRAVGGDIPDVPSMND